MDDRTRRIAGERSWRNRHSKTHEGVLGDSRRIDEEGVLGEQAFAVYMKLEHEPIESKRPVNYNFKLADGTRVDVRASSVKNARLIVPPAILARKNADVFVLAEIVTPKRGKATVDDVKLRGWATAEEMAAKTPQVISDRPNATPVHVMWQSRLRPMEELKARHEPKNLSLF